MKSNDVNRMSFISVKPLEPSDVQYRSRDHLKIVGAYALGRHLGEGSYGKVKEGVNIQSHQRVAVKIYSKRYIKKIEGGEASALKEIEIMKSLRNDHIVQAIDDFNVKEKDKMYVVLEYVNGGNLQDLLDRAPNNILPPRQMRHIFKGLICGLVYLQEEGIIHRDIKPDNLLLTSDGDVKIADFGVAVKIDMRDDKALETFKWKQGDIGGSPAFQPPECQEIDYSSIPDLDELGPLLTKRDGKVAPLKLDVWSAGVVLYIMVVGKFPFESPNIITLFTNIARGKFTIPDWVTPELVDLLRGILQVDPDNRLSLAQIKKHPWMKANLPNDNQLIVIEAIPSLFGNDNKTLCQVLEDLQNRKGTERDKEVQNGDEESFSVDSGSGGSTEQSPIEEGSITDSEGAPPQSTSSSKSEKDMKNSKGPNPEKIQKSEKSSKEKIPKHEKSSKEKLPKPEKGNISKKNSKKENTTTTKQPSKRSLLKNSSSMKMTASTTTTTTTTTNSALSSSDSNGKSDHPKKTVIRRKTENGHRRCHLL